MRGKIEVSLRIFVTGISGLEGVSEHHLGRSSVLQVVNTVFGNSVLTGNSEGGHVEEFSQLEKPSHD